MQQWEYCRFFLHEHLVRYYVPDGGMPDLRATDNATTIYQLGMDGWELVSHTAWFDPNYGEKEVMTFKRPKVT